MNRIHVLPEIVANKIAAGEVIERPASIVKELVENAIDAGATHVAVEIRNGGKSRIRVNDNGCGMNKADAALALQRHATSKILKSEDLESIRYFGFRGEALPSIAAVSRMTLETAEADSKAGVRIEVEGGHVKATESAPPRNGTSVEVRDLFFNTPARRKFLRADATEAGHIQETVCNLALAHLDIHFTLRSNDKSVIDALPAESLEQRAYQLFGNETAKHLIPVEASDEGLRVYGLIGKPGIARSNRSAQRWFVNKRSIKSTGLSFALQEGYHGLLLHGRYPMAQLFIEVNPKLVDVNVHPTKQEVRMEREREIKSLIMRAVSERLRSTGDLSPELKPSRSAAEPSALSRYKSSASDMTFFARDALAAVPAIPEQHSTKTAAAEAPAEPIALRDALEITRILGQLHRMFLVVETTEGMLLIDQHAAHERVMYETLLAQISQGRVESQALLLDEILELHPRQSEVMAEALPLLRRMGFDIEPFGENAFIVHEYPSIFGGENPAEAVKHFLDEKESGRLRGKLETQLEAAAALIACKRKSVKAQDTLNPEAARTLLARLAQCDNPFACPHGRPTLIKYRLSELERQFQRIS